MLAEKLPPEFTGSGKQAIYLSNALSQKNIQVIGLCSTPSGKSYIDYSEGFPIVHVSSSRRIRIRSFQFMIKCLFWLLRNRDKYDILHIHGYCGAAISSIVLCRILNKKTIYKVAIPGDDDPITISRSRLGRLKGIFLNRVDGFVAISERVRKTIVNNKCSSAKVFLIPNGVDKKFFFNKEISMEAKRYVTKTYGSKDDLRIVCYVGSIEHRKGIDLLAKAWPRIVSVFPDSCLLLVGPYSEEADFYRQIIESLKQYLGKTVFFVGTVTDPEIYYRASDVLVFPSRNESFGNVLVEAMACGTACVATRIEGITDDILLNSYNGLLVDQEDNEALADSVVSILRNPELKRYLAMNAVKTVDEKFRIDMIAEKYVELYEYLLYGNEKLKRAR
jgi:glycosyltransferase involved in cell wall biosynthesis